jgi:ribosome-associated heat shock protein Hsp15
MAGLAPDGTWQRLDAWLWCARVLRHRADCVRLIETGLIRINRQPTDKPHARLRVGDVLTVPAAGDVRVWRVLALAARRGPASEARRLYDPIDEAATVPAPAASVPCTPGPQAAYRRDPQSAADLSPREE